MPSTLTPSKLTRQALFLSHLRDLARRENGVTERRSPLDPAPMK
ncbi:MAG: hypothetical protein AAFX40_18145 [Cyanobacteria bacterium J06639_1]